MKREPTWLSFFLRENWALVTSGAVRGPLGHIPMTAVGGVRPETIASFLDAGVVGFGVGGELVRKDLLRAGDMAGITARAREFVAAITTWEARKKA